MGDRSYCRFRIPRPVFLARRDAIEAILEPEGDDGDEGHALVTVECSDRQGGGFHEANELLAAGVAHLSEWEGGCDFDAGASIFIPGEQPVEVTTMSGAPAVTFDADSGEVSAADLQACRAFVALRRRLEALGTGAEAPMPADASR